MNLADYLEFHARVRGDKPAIEASDATLTYAELNIAAQRFAAQLRSNKVGRGDVVGLLMTETPAHVAALMGIARIGAIALALDWRATPVEFARSVSRFKPVLVLSDNPRAATGQATIVDAQDADRAEPDATPPERLLNAPLIYGISSGTTGLPKAMVVTHEVQHARFVNISTEFPLLREDRFLAALPLAFAAGQIFTLAPLAAGATIVQLPAMYGAKEIVDLVRSRNVTVVHLPPNMTRKLLALAPSDGKRLMPSLRLFVSGTGGLSVEERADVRRRIAPSMLALYGCAGGGPVAMLHDRDDLEAPDSVGLTIPTLAVDIVNEDGKPVRNGEAGWIRLRGAATVSEILGGDPDSDEGVRDGWYHPGDIGRFDERGYLHLLGRSTELIKRGGKTVYSKEIEHALLAHPAVNEAAVIGMPGGDIGEEVVAFVILTGSADPAELIKHCRGRLSAFKVPSRVIVRESFPRNSIGKVLKAELKQLVPG